MKYSKNTIKKENNFRSLFLFHLYNLCFMLYDLHLCSILSYLCSLNSLRLFTNTKLPKDILQQIVIRNLSRDFTQMM
jgi:hypothetical protein